MASPVSNQITLTRSNKFQMAHLNKKWYTQLQHDSRINFLLSNCRKNTELLSREIFLNKSYYIPAPPIFRMPSQISNSRGNLAMDNLAAFIDSQETTKMSSSRRPTYTKQHTLQLSYCKMSSKKFQNTIEPHSILAIVTKTRIGPEKRDVKVKE